jgi:hypothetical protein
MGKGQLLQLGTDPVAADGPGERRVDIQGLPGDALALGRCLDVLEGPHVVQTVRQLDHQDPDVPGDGEDELPEVLGLAGVLAVQFELGELGDPLHKSGDLLTEQAPDLGGGGIRVLDGVMEQGRDNRRRIHPILGQDACHLDRMGEIGVPGGALLGTVHAHGVDIGAVKDSLLGAGIVGEDLIDQLVLPQYRAAARHFCRRGRKRGTRLCGPYPLCWGRGLRRSLRCCARAQ